jgi:hypothetical protein
MRKKVDGATRKKVAGKKAKRKSWRDEPGCPLCGTTLRIPEDAPRRQSEQYGEEVGWIYCTQCPTKCMVSVEHRAVVSFVGTEDEPEPVRAYKEALARYGEMGADTPEKDVEAALELCDTLWRKLTPAQQAAFDGPPEIGVKDTFAALTAACARGAVGDWEGCQVQLIAADERAPQGLPKTAVRYLLQVTEEMLHR